MNGVWSLWALLLAAAVTADAAAAAERGRSRANPIRKVVTMLQAMQKKVQEEGEQKKDLFDKFMCYCKKGGAGLQQSVAAAEERVPELSSSLEESTAMHQQLTEDLKQHKHDRSEATKAVQTAEALRKKDADAFATEVANLKSNIAQLGKATAAIEKGNTGGFLQTSAVEVLKRLSLSLDMAGADRELLTSFLDSGSGGRGRHAQGYAPQSGEVLGILKQMQEEMSKDLSELTSKEESDVANYESLLGAKKKEIGAATKAIEDKTGRAGELAVELTTVSNDLEDTKEGLQEDVKFLADLKKSCVTKQEEWDVYKTIQADEMVTLAEAIKILNEDDALELFKKTLPGPAAASFVQLAATRRATRSKASTALWGLASGAAADPRVDLLEMALRGQKAPKAGLDKVVAQIGQLGALLVDEQKADDNKKAFCLAEISTLEDDNKALARSAAYLKTVIADTDDSLQEVSRQIKALMLSIKDLDRQVAEATSTRKAEHAASVDALAADSASKSLIEMAENRLRQFYAQKPAAFAQVRLHGTGLLGGELTSLLGRGADSPPEVDLSYKKKEAQSGGVLELLNTIKSDLIKQITELEMEEKEAQKDYEAFIEDCSGKRALDSKAISDKEGAKAELEAKLHKEKADLKGETAALLAAEKELMSLHGECDWLLKNFELRKQARADEADGLQKAKAVLSGADYS